VVRLLARGKRVEETSRRNLCGYEQRYTAVRWGGFNDFYPGKAGSVGKREKRILGESVRAGEK